MIACKYNVAYMIKHNEETDVWFINYENTTIHSCTLASLQNVLRDCGFQLFKESDVEV